MTAMDTLASDSCHTLSDTDIETISQEELVIFDTVQTCYSNQKDIIVLYTSGTAVQHTRSDWIGLFKKGWQTTSDYSLHQWVPFDPISTWQPRRRKTIFSQADVSKLSGTFQFLYVAGEEQVLGVSETFQISDKDLPSGSALSNQPPQSLSLHSLEFLSSSSLSSEDHAHCEYKVNKIKSLSDHTLAQSTNSSFKSNEFSSLQDSATLSDFHLPLSNDGFYQKLKFVKHGNEEKARSNHDDLNYLNLCSPLPQGSKLIQELEDKLQSSSSKSSSIIFSPYGQKAFPKAIHFHPYQRPRQSLALSMSRENFHSLWLEVYRNAVPDSSFLSFDPFKSLTKSDVNKLKVWKTASTNDIKEDNPLSISNVISKIQEPPPSSSQASEAEMKDGDTDEDSSSFSILDKKSQNVCNSVLKMFEKKMPSENDDRERCTTSRSLKKFTFSFTGNEVSNTLVPTWPKNFPLSMSGVEKPQTSADPCVKAPKDEARRENHSFVITASTDSFLASAGFSTNGPKIAAKFHGTSFLGVSRPRKRSAPTLNGRVSSAKKRHLSQVKFSGRRLQVGSMADKTASDLIRTCFSGEATAQLAEMTERISLLDMALLEALKENADLRGKLLCMEEKMQKMNQDGGAEKDALNKRKERKSSRRTRAISEKQTTKKAKTITNDDIKTQEPSNLPQTTRPSSQASNGQNCCAKVADAKVTPSAPRSKGRGPNSGHPESSRPCVPVKKGASEISGVTVGKTNEKMLPATRAGVKVSSDKAVNTSSPKHSVAVKSDRKPQKAPCDQEDNSCYCHPNKASSTADSSSQEQHTPEKWDVVSSKRMVRLKRLVARKKEEFAQLRDSVEKDKQRVEILQEQLRAVRTTLSFETRRRLNAEKDLNVIRIRFWELISARKWQGWGAFNTNNVMVSSASSLGIFGDAQEGELLSHLKALPWKMEKDKQNESTKVHRFSGWYARKNENVQTTKGGEKMSGACADESLADDTIGEDEEAEMQKSIRDLRRSVTFRQFLLPHETVTSAGNGMKNKNMKVNAAAAMKSANTTGTTLTTRPSSSHSSRFKSKQMLLKGRVRVTRKRKESNLAALEHESVTSPPQHTRRHGVRGQSLQGPDQETKEQWPESDGADDSGVDDVLDEDSKNWSPPPVNVQLQGAKSSVVVVGGRNNSSLLGRPSGDLLAKRGRFSSLVNFTHNDLRPGQRSASHLAVLNGASCQPPPDVVMSATPLTSLVGCGNSSLGAGQAGSHHRPGHANRFLPDGDLDVQQPGGGGGAKPRALHFEYNDKMHNHNLNQQIRLGRCLTCGMRFSHTLDRLLAEEHMHLHHAFTE